MRTSASRQALIQLYESSWLESETFYSQPVVTSSFVPFRHLVVIHYHLRPGGVRRVIERSLPFLLSAGFSKPVTITFVTGELAETEWENACRRSLASHQVRFVPVPAFGYFSESRRSAARLREEIDLALSGLVPDEETKETLIWTHNLALGRNLILSDAVGRWAGARDLALLSHHHDFWFENRWRRWKEMRQSGYRTLAEVSRVTLGGPGAIILINRGDEDLWKRYLPKRTRWIPNPVSRPAPPTRRRVLEVQGKLGQDLGDNGPIWLVPTRFLRRKNLAESILLTRWLRPEAWLITTAGVSSAGEQPYARALKAAARKGKWRVRFGILSGTGRGWATIDEIIAAAEVILLTSVQEGFGLPILEAAAAGKPLIARTLPRLQRDFQALGISSPQGYDDVQVPHELVDWGQERIRRQTLWRTTKAILPGSLRDKLGPPPDESATVPFSRLTLEAQLEILALPVEESWAACRNLNPFLIAWKNLAVRSELAVASWPMGMDSALESDAMVANWRRAVSQAGQSALGPADPKAGKALQGELINRALQAKSLFPILLG